MLVSAAVPRRELPDPVWRAVRARLGGPPATAAPLQEVAEAARRAGVAPLLATSGDRALAQLLADDLTTAITRDALLEQTERRVAALLTGEAVCLLKGGATGRLVYDAPYLRPRRDIDVLVASDRVEPIAARFVEAGWNRRAAEAWWARDAEPYEVTLAWELPGGGVVECDLHRRLAAWTHLGVDVAGMLSRARPGEAPLPLCDPSDALLHTCLHAVTAGFCVPLRSWVDVQRLLRHPDVDLTTVAGTARDWGVSQALWVALRIVRRWLGAAIDPVILDGLAPPPPERAALATLLSGDGEHPIRRLGAGTRAAVAAAKALALGDAVGRLKMLTQLLGR